MRRVATLAEGRTAGAQVSEEGWMEVGDLEALVGYQFPGGTFTISAYEDWLMRDVMLLPPGDGRTAHPIWAFAAPQRSMGITIDDVFRLCGSSAAEGPMLGDTDIVLDEPLLIDEPYVVSGGIVSAVRKHGETAGTFDLVHFRVDSRDRRGRPVSALTNSFVYVRRVFGIEAKR